MVEFVCLAIAGILLLEVRSRFSGTTLVAPWAWCILSLLSLVWLQWLEATGPAPARLTACRYAAAMTTFCPLMGLLGAKRPQDRGWQFIVLTLWIVLVLPVAEQVVLWSGGALDEGPARRWFLVILLLLGASNYLPTRFAPAALLVTAGQCLLVLPHLPFGLTWEAHWPWGLRLLVGGMLVGRFTTVFWPRKSTDWNRVWADFRDAFGTVWALRVMERVHATQRVSAWTATLGWFGFEQLSHDESDVARAMRTVLRRFVSEDWIDRRLPDGGPRAHPD